MGGGKSYRRFEGKDRFEGSDLVNFRRFGVGLGFGGVNCTDDLRVSRTWRFWGGGKSSNIFHQVNTFHLLS